MKRIVQGASVIALGLFLSLLTAAHAADKPNVVLMLADNVGWGDVGVYGGGEIRGMPSPRLDQLASEGMQMMQFLVEPGCTPSRAALMTGRYSVRSARWLALHDLDSAFRTNSCFLD